MCGIKTFFLGGEGEGRGFLLCLGKILQGILFPSHIEHEHGKSTRTVQEWLFPTQLQC